MWQVMLCRKLISLNLSRLREIPCLQNVHKPLHHITLNRLWWNSHYTKNCQLIYNENHLTSFHMIGTCALNVSDAGLYQHFVLTRQIQEGIFTLTHTTITISIVRFFIKSWFATNFHRHGADGIGMSDKILSWWNQFIFFIVNIRLSFNRLYGLLSLPCHAHFVQMFFNKKVRALLWWIGEVSDTAFAKVFIANCPHGVLFLNYILFCKQHFHKQLQAKSQANAKQHPEDELWLLENYSHSSSTFSSKNNRTYSKNKQKNKCFCIHEIIRWIIRKMRMKKKTRSHGYDINRPRSIYRHKYSKYKTCLSLIMLICIKVQLSNIWSSIREKVKQHWNWVEKSVTYKTCIWKKYLFEKMYRVLSKFTDEFGLSWWGNPIIIAVFMFDP